MIASSNPIKTWQRRYPETELSFPGNPGSSPGLRDPESRILWRRIACARFQTIHDVTLECEQSPEAPCESKPNAKCAAGVSNAGF